MTPLLLSLLVGQQAAPAPDWRITGAALFKNGYSVVFREADVKGVQSLELPILGGASLGTLWFTAEGVKIASIVSTTSTAAAKTPVQGIAGLLVLNKGKTLKLTAVKTGGGEEHITAQVVDVLPTHVVLKTGSGELVQPLDSIRKVESTGGASLKYQIETKTPRRTYRFSFEKAGRGKVMAMSLEPGLFWSPAYAVSLADDGRLTLTSKATIINSLPAFSSAELMLVTGFPNIPYLGQPDPMAEGPAVLAAQLSRAPGGFGGGAAFMNQALPAPSMERDMSMGVQVPQGEGSQSEDLFFYRPPRISMKQGDRGYYVLFQKTADYKSVYKADLPDPLSGGRELVRTAEVWHTLEFRNPAGQPLTTGPALTMRDGHALGQDEIKYTPAGADVSLKVNKALDIQVSQTSEETARVREALKNRDGYPTHDLVTIEGRIQVKNMKAKAVTVALTMPVDGEASAPEGSIQKAGSGLTQVNSRSIATWRISLASGEVKTLTFSSRVYVGR